MNRLSLKLGLLFLAFILLIEVGLFFYLYTGLAGTRISEELESLRLRGNSHREVLEKHHDSATLSHVALMESEAETDVIITDEDGKIVRTSSPLVKGAREAVEQWQGYSLRYKGEIMQGDWKNKPYIATASPIRLNQKNAGTVYMFENTKDIQDMIARLQHHFYIVGVISVLFSIITVFALSKFITLPLIRMKQATQKLSQGDFSVKLGAHSRDELGQLGTSIQTLANELHRLKEERNEFLSSISHELQTPLMYLKGYADVAKRQSNSEVERNKYLNIIEEEAQRLSQLVKDLFQLAQLDQHTFLIQKQNVKLYSYLHHIIQHFDLVLKEKDIQLHLNCPQEIEVNIDPERFQQVVVNLLDNALKYSDNGTEILIIVRELPKKVTITFKDQGIGIPSTDLPYVFDKLYRVEKSRSRKSGGYGLGLSIVKEIVESHGGAVTIESGVGKGTMVEILLREDV
ncbi:sensor histidine kinase (plasmid) [Priestia megaterium]|uniref:sensor histidine kinase n=1 Tax=Priestia TaxID=2800373 RepID=UPI00196A6760|nr:MULTISPECIES: HAMP domain-containing sensor histidine kinase [Priestia]MCW1048982.1 HAMP domain-containing histidine kinase [Priestia sp. JV24]QSF42081.1 HAMP domain-containing histidine kinase [Priestia megaterium]